MLDSVENFGDQSSSQTGETRWISTYLGSQLEEVGGNGNP